MANELTYHSAANTGDTLYAQVENMVGQLWNGSAFEAPVSGSWATYDIAMSEQATSTGVFRATMPAASAGAYVFIVRKQAGGSPAVGDIVLGSSQVFGWDGSVITSIAAIKAKTDNLPTGVAKNVALSNFTFLMIDSADDVTPKTGLTVTAQISKDGAAFGNAANAVAEIANGFYKLDITQGEMNADIVCLKFTATGANQTSITMVTDT